MNRRYLRRILWKFYLWRMQRQLPRSHAQIMKELDDARANHRRTAHIHEKLRKSAHQGLRA